MISSLHLLRPDDITQLGGILGQDLDLSLEASL